jgi:hypothetical protein
MAFALGLGIGIPFGGIIRNLATQLLGGEENGVAFDFTDDSALVRDTTVTNNTWPAASGATGTRTAQDWFKRRSFASYTAPSPKLVRQQSGIYAYAPHNLIGMSEKFDSAYWSKSGSTITADQDVAPDGTTTADLQTANGGSASYIVFPANGAATTANHPYTISCYFKAGTNNYPYIRNRFSTNNWAAAVFDLTDGLAVASQTAAGATSGTVISTAKESVGNGWYRCSLTSFVNSTATSPTFGVALAGTGNSFSTDGVITITPTAQTYYLWGVQLNYGYTVLAYQRTEDHNLVIQSQVLDTSWTATDITVVNNDTASPDGTTTAEELTEGTAGTALLRSTAFTVPASAVVTASIWLKVDSGATWVRFTLADGSDTNGLRGWFNIATGAAGTLSVIGAGTATSHSITSWGNGWYRLSITGVCSTSTSLTMSFSSASADASNTRVNSVVYWGFGVQAVLGTSAGKYVPTTTAAVYSNYFALPYEWSAAGAAQGVLIEEARTNLATVSTDFSSVTWTKLNTTVSADAAIAPDGTTTADKLIEDAGSAQHRMSFGTINFTSGTTYTVSIYAKAAGRGFIILQIPSAVVGTAISVWFDLALGTATQTSGTPSLTQITPCANGWFRFSISGAATATVAAQPVVYMDNSGTGSATYNGDGTSGVYFWGAQCEAGAFPTSPIYTAGASVTRAGDAPTLNFALAPAFNETGTMLLNARPAAIKNSAFIRSSNSWFVMTNSGTEIRIADGTNTPLLGSTVAGANTVIGCAYSGATMDTRLDAAQIQDNTSYDGGFVVSSANSLIFGEATALHVKRFMALPRRMSDAELMAVAI